MKKIKLCLALVMIILAFSGCSNTKSLTRNEISDVVQKAYEYDSSKRQEASELVKMASSYYEKGWYDKSADLLYQAATLFYQINDRHLYRETLLSCAKLRLKAGDTKRFLETMTEFRSLIGQYEMPSYDERLLLDIYDAMSGGRLSYPLEPEWKKIFPY